MNELAVRIDCENPAEIEIRWYSNKENVASLIVRNEGNGKLGVWLEGVKIAEMPEGYCRSPGKSDA